VPKVAQGLAEGWFVQAPGRLPHALGSALRDEPLYGWKERGERLAIRRLGEDPLLK
jgi:hypothetical protein